jgi:two-component system, NtrC family, response regulator AtoC
VKILVVDDEFGLRQALSRILDAEGHEVAVAEDGGRALELINSGSPDLVLCDVRMPGMNGLAFLEQYRANKKGGLVIMMSAYEDDEGVIEAMRRGAYDFIAKPFRADQLLLTIRKAVERERLRQTVEQLQEELSALRAPSGIVGRGMAMQQVLAVAAKVARHPSTVLVTGESGTGKELVARYIHASSPRAESALVAVNCGAIPENLLESELFGHAKGAFTGATAEKRGLFEEADGGTLFLDEIGELPAPLQVKLLRALQEGEIRRVGDNTARAVDVRLVAATARDLEAEVAAGRFRADLYYRINVVRLHLPPLRDRREDIPELVRHFVQLYGRRLGLSVNAVSPPAMRLLMEYSWPGNVRELENVIERALVLAEGSQIEPDQLPAAIRSPGATAPAVRDELDLSIKRQTAALERGLIRSALERTGGNRTRAAKLLELSHRALLYKIREYGLGN